ncbi:MAG: glucose sorbosone dehydrogenase [Candidatus Lokiarchaeota archaeon]|nr:glucose sorbosone dehydrogenase [Candidatus Lokiarchaeota archaeon]MBD3200330.1 glucose sorbosone dehydrogenase [Candidatus Lokiarchaeota archaeon]
MKSKYKTITVILSLVIIIASTLLILQFFLVQEPTYDYQIEQAFPNLTFDEPVGIYDPKDGTNRLFVLEQDGLIQVFENNENTTSKVVFLDISGSVGSGGGEQGLLGLAFHPNFTENGYFYVDYTDTAGDTVISQFTINSTDINRANTTSEKLILSVSQPYSNHNGGQLAFGPEGYLYISLGDGGGAGDPNGNGQNRSSLLGSILRIDVDSGDPYAIPDDNPFKNNINGYKEEIYAYGLRNPWRFSFDPNSNLLIAADVGQLSWEEIDIIESGKNYGWNIMEGAHCYDAPLCNTTGLELPIYEYSHTFGYSITGGFVYRGSKLTSLVGSYIYGDYGNGKIWTLELQGDNVISNTLLRDTELKISSFGIDYNNEIYLCDYVSGKLYKISENILS